MQEEVSVPEAFILTCINLHRVYNLIYTCHLLHFQTCLIKLMGRG